MCKQQLPRERREEWREQRGCSGWHRWTKGGFRLLLRRRWPYRGQRTAGAPGTAGAGHTCAGCFSSSCASGGNGNDQGVGHEKELGPDGPTGQKGKPFIRACVMDIYIANSNRVT